MTNTKFLYTITVEGCELDAKNAQKLKPDDKLSLTRLCDENDSFEIVITTLNGQELDMLSYQESVGIAPFLDDGSLTVVDANVSSVKVIQGKTKKLDKTIVTFETTFCYDETKLVDFENRCAVKAFLPIDDIFYTLCLYKSLDYDMPIISQTHLNRYVFEVDIDSDTKDFFDFDFNDENYFYTAEMLFNQDFSECKVKSKVYSDSFSQDLQMEEKSAQDFFTLINHYRIFCDEAPLDPCDILL